ncbi:MAG TPA: molybdopterin converting factor subunit 1 [Polyangiaceae bacterium]|jgi:molybdopterin synthase sulfur carrier subunit|nr:molybdopterin converting factor subunit 1 [Polyangiaceae bacterium]
MGRTITLLFFAAVREHAGKSEEAVELGEAVRTLADLPAFLERRYPSLAGRLGSVRYAVNEAFGDSDTPLAGGDVVAVLPPVSGG